MQPSTHAKSACKESSWCLLYSQYVCRRTCGWFGLSASKTCVVLVDSRTSRPFSVSSPQQDLSRGICYFNLWLTHLVLCRGLERKLQEETFLYDTHTPMNLLQKGAIAILSTAAAFRKQVVEPLRSSACALAYFSLLHILTIIG